MTDAHATGPDTGGLAFDNPEAYIARDRRRAMSEGRQLPDRVHGSALFADISGFTTVTEVLASELGSQHGAEELTANLNRVFHHVIAELDRFGGDVIYFSGDAVTCWLDGDDGSRAAACALAMQAAMDRVGEVVTPAGTVVPLAIKVAVVVGPARRFAVGDPEIQLMDVLAGSLVDELASAERSAAAGEVVLGQSALRSLGDRAAVGAQRVDVETGASMSVLARLRVPVADAAVAEPATALPEHEVRPWLLPAVYERVRAGRGELMAELRPAIPVFVRFGGIDYDADDAAAAKLDDFVCRAQRVLTGFGGNLVQLTLGDKGAYLYAVFGSPHAHEDDADRAVAAALELRSLDSVTDVAGIQTGISTGRIWTGTYGHAMRRTFTCLGDAVNLAARLMSSAPPGQVYATEAVREQAGDSFTWERLPDLRVKGKAGLVAASSLVGAISGGLRRRRRYELELVGRRAELATLDAALDSSLRGSGNVVGIAAEAGMGKSRLVAEFVRSVRAEGRLVAFGECPAFGANANYGVWREIWRSLLGVDEQQPEDVQLAMLEHRLAEIDPTLVPRTPLLDLVLGLSIPDSELTRTLDPKLRKASFEALLAQCLRARAADEPLVLVLEDCHWIEPLSRDLLEVLVRATSALPVLFVLNYRPASEPGGDLGIAGLAQFVEIELTDLEPADTERLVRVKLAQLFGPDTDVPAALIELVRTRSRGNPFYLEELLNYVHGEGVDLGDEASLRGLDAPGSLHSLILSRIDTLGESPRRTVKVASVVGRAFHAPTLLGVYPELGSPDGLRGDLGTLRTVDLVTLDREDIEEYSFKHVVTQEVTYESLPFATRAMLHERVAAHIEKTGADSIEHQLDLLAHHYWHSGNVAKKREFLVRAGEAAQASYANAAAIDYYERAAPLVGDQERIDLLLRLGKVLDLAGDWQRAEKVEREALALAEQLGDARSQAWCEAALAEEARRQGRYDEAAALLATAATIFGEVADDAGLGQVHHLAGTLAAQQGDYDQAVERYEASLEIRTRLGDDASIGSLLSNLGIVAEYRGDYDVSRGYHERALAIREAIGDRWAIAVSLTNLGTIAVNQGDDLEARARLEEAMRLSREVGDAWMVANTHNNLGNASRGLGDHDAARHHYAASLRAYREYDDAWAMAYLLEDIGLLASLRDDAELALELVGAADTLREEIHAPRAPALEEQLEAQLAQGAGALDVERRQAARNRGRARGQLAAFEVALAFCEAEGT